jgi:Domain of unknown function (DUF4864)
MRFSGLCLALNIALGLVAALPGIAGAEDPVRAAQTTIASQISAFLHDDDRTAYSFASPDIKAVFPDSESFLVMVRKTYAPVYRPANYAFGRVRTTDDGARVFQEVLISALDGKNWAAFYELIRQPDGRYAVNGVRVARDLINQGL